MRHTSFSRGAQGRCKDGPWSVFIVILAWILVRVFFGVQKVLMVQKFKDVITWTYVNIVSF